ncbi:hypothetical protein K440DRAFT_230477 [Wilcoxina mikolae CBS 423.85]|nr:hypothetical protein K440DRAFT_230477 [Wilcoxina mikolae CBS 423.85]
MVDIASVTDSHTKKVSKIGRTSGLTFGEVMTLPIRIGGLPRFPNRIAEMHCAIPIGRTTFCDKGDSGGPVAFDEKALGMTQGNAIPHEEPYKGMFLGVFIAMDDLIKRAKERFGIELVLYGI